MTPTEQQENEIREAWLSTSPADRGFLETLLAMTGGYPPFQEFKRAFLSGHAAAMQKREEETKAIEWCLGKSGEEIVVQMAALQENAKAYYRVKLELAAAKEMGENLVEALRSQTPSRCTTAYELREEALAAYEASWKGRGV